MHNWFQVKIKYQKIDEATGKDKTVKESYLIDGVSFTEVEAIAYKVLEEELGQEFIITHIAALNISDVFYGEGSDIWYKCKVVYIDADPANGREKKTGTWALVGANSNEEAISKLKNELKDVLIPWEIKSTAETNIIDVFPYDANRTAEKAVEGMVPMSEYENKEEEVYNSEDDEEQEQKEMEDQD